MNQKYIILELFKLTESGEPINLDEMLRAVISYASFNDKGEYQDDNYKERIKTFRLQLNKLFRDLDKVVDEAKDVSDKQVAYFRNRMERLKTLPLYADVRDTDKVLKFIKALPDKDFYNISSAAELIGNITRQTLKKKIDKGYLNIKPVYLSRAALIKKEDIIRIYREMNTTEEDYYGF